MYVETVRTVGCLIFVLYYLINSIIIKFYEITLKSKNSRKTMKIRDDLQNTHIIYERRSGKHILGNRAGMIVKKIY